MRYTTLLSSFLSLSSVFQKASIFQQMIVLYLLQAAANCYSMDEHLKTAPIWALAEKAKMFYSAGYPLTVCPEGMLALAEHASQNDKVYCLNLSAEFICQFFQASPILLMSNEMELKVSLKRYN